MEVIIKYISTWSPRYLQTLIYMLQATEYRPSEYVRWVWRVADFWHVSKRRTIVYTMKATLLLLGLVLLYLAVISWSLTVVLMGAGWLAKVVAVGIVVFLPLLAAYVVVLPLWIGRALIQAPKEKALMTEATAIFKNHPGYVIAVAGSYGKTTMKEVLAKVLAGGRKVAMTPGNMNTAIGISRFAKTLKGDEEVIIVELGEETVGDVTRLCSIVQPDAGIITGISAAHVSSFGSMEAIISTIFELRDAVGDGPLYVNGESEYVFDRVLPSDVLYSRHGCGEWRIKNAKTSIHGTTFVAEAAKKIVHAQTGLLGLHTVGVVAAAIAMADRFELKPTVIEAAVSKVVPFEHRMQARQVAGAWVIDDTYNGNIAGVRAGLDVLAALPADRKLYVTPGLVEQGTMNEAVHHEMGQRIAKAGVDEVILMRNSVTDLIRTGLEHSGFKGEVVVIDEPLLFYTHLDQYLAHGDVVLMQNDWTDNYN